MSDRQAKEIGQEIGLAFSSPLYFATALPASDLLFCCASFRKKTERWPKDYTELTEFVGESNGYLWLGDYDRVDLAQLPDDVLEIAYVPKGFGSPIKLRMGGKPHKK